MPKHRAPRRRRGHAPHPAPAADNPPTNPDLTPPPWLRLVPTDWWDPPEPAQVLPARPQVTVQYPGGERLSVPIESGMVLQLSCVDGQPRISVNLA